MNQTNDFNTIVHAHLTTAFTATAGSSNLGYFVRFSRLFFHDALCIEISPA